VISQRATFEIRLLLLLSNSSVSVSRETSHKDIDVSLGRTKSFLTQTRFVLHSVAVFPLVAAYIRTNVDYRTENFACSVAPRDQMVSNQTGACSSVNTVQTAVG